MDCMVPQLFNIVERRQDTKDVFSFRLKCPDSFSFSPGQFNMLYTFGVGEVPISISGNIQNKNEIWHTIRDVGPVTQGLSLLQVGDHVGLRGPYGKGWPTDPIKNDSHVIIVTGGIGLAPLRPLILMLASKTLKAKKVSLLIGSRHPDDLLYMKDIAAWSQLNHFEVFVTVDHAGADWKGEVGVVTKLLDKVDPSSDQLIAYVCGPEIMMRFVAKDLLMAGLTERDIYLSMERNMKCAVAFCGHCQLGPEFICKDGPVFDYQRLIPLMNRRNL